MYHILNDEEYAEYRKLKDGVDSYMAVMNKRRWELNDAVGFWEQDGCNEIANGLKNKLHAIDFAIGELNKLI